MLNEFMFSKHLLSFTSAQILSLKQTKQRYNVNERFIVKLIYKIILHTSVHQVTKLKKKKKTNRYFNVMIWCLKLNSKVKHKKKKKIMFHHVLFRFWVVPYQGNLCCVRVVMGTFKSVVRSVYQTVR